MYKYVLWAAVLLLFFSCSNEPRPSSSGQVPPKLWVQYKIWGEEGDSTATCMLQFFSDAQKRQTLMLEPPSGVQIDGQPLVADSAGIVGAFYEYHAAAHLFAGRHTILFEDGDEQVFEDNFIFQPFTLERPLPAVLSGGDLELSLRGLSDGSAVRIVLIDTTEAGRGINELVKVHNEKLLLPAHYWSELAPGPIILHLTAEEERPLKSRLQGQMLITYGLSRILELQK